ncbi:hypothetical protein LAG90_09575 [Marinilongibacter aquaticus]|uniref:hypothetical protein n=1 Tax=Marinilongibacter aquaticus TaxID=2975157 RepID=UPI0021BD7ED6|nr:hypothetical protein [Marinilongibacter aquaticus]UBM60881.1 hypothetical protein LAG90_09575 [Marinilongibacter aquaticus]
MQEACAIFDILPHQIKLVVYSTNYAVLYNDILATSTIDDDDGMPTVDLLEITKWVKEHVLTLKQNADFKLKAVNFVCYGATLVHLNAQGAPVLPLYDFKRSFGYKNRKAFLESYGGEEKLKTSLQIPEIGFEDMALQLYWVKKQKPEQYKLIKYSVSLPQYLQSIFTQSYNAEYTSIGCHSGAWDFNSHDYAEWLKKENLHSILLPLKKASEGQWADGVFFGHGVFNKIADLESIKQATSGQFVLLNTGLWTVCINPFNHATEDLHGLKQNSFSILDGDGQAIRMARLFSGDAHNRQINYLSSHFNISEDFHHNIRFDSKIIRRLRQEVHQVRPESTELGSMMDCPFMERNINTFTCIEDAYHQFFMDLIAQQIASIKLTFDHQANRKIFVDGDLAKSEIFMSLLAEAMHDKAVYKIGNEHNASIGAALLIAKHWAGGKVSSETLRIELQE